VIIGGLGPRRTPSLAARFADEFNVPFGSLEQVQQMYARVREACQESGRDALPVFSAAETIACGRTEAEARKRAENIGKTPALYGTPDQVVEQISRYAELGATRLFLQVLDMSDLDHLDVIASEIAPQLA
jgi:alkanesulfonate monooxygenase SsuD/methylene tetrahydromethanopterin reductase-like flavin-dependent oxidoreductase (luciferase family)